jgi:sugar O-acyltransferase (sialic acid O-acetyltransferase NeuD family)
MAKIRVAVIGAGGFAREVRWLIEEITRSGKQQFQFLGYVVSDLNALGAHDDQKAVLGDYGWLEEHSNSVDAVTIGIGTPSVRKTVATTIGARYPNLDWPALIHPSVQADFVSCKIGTGSILCAGVIATVAISISPFVMVNLACTIGHEAQIGAYSVLNPTVNISGGVTLRDRVLVGTGAQVLQYVEVGSGASIGAGAVVTKNVDADTTVVGIPAKPLLKK